jgi:ATP-dependent DNA helicase RecG
VPDKLPINLDDLLRQRTVEGRTAFVIRLLRHPQAKNQAAGEGAYQATGQGIIQVADQVTDRVARLLKVVRGEQARSALQAALGLKHAPHFRRVYLLPALAAGYLEMTLPGQPNSRLQRYRLTETGRRVRDLLSLPRRKPGSRR